MVIVSMVTMVMMMTQTVMICPPHLDIMAVTTVQLSFLSRVNLHGIYTHHIVTRVYIISFFFSHLLNSHRDKVEQFCSFCGLKVANFSKLVEHHLQEHPTQIEPLLQGKKKKRKGKHVNPRPSGRVDHNVELHESGDVVSVRSTFKGDIIVTRLRNPTPQNTDIYVLFLNLRRRIKDIFRKYYTQRGSFR